MKLDLGSGPRPAQGFLGVDSAPGCGSAEVEVVEFDLASGKRWPWADGSVEALRSSHLIEHIAACTVPSETLGGRMQDALFFFFDEAYRVIEPGGRFELRWPCIEGQVTASFCFPGPVFQDPTHRRFLSADFLFYLSRHGRRQLAVEQYTVSCDWTLISRERSMTTAGAAVEYIAWLQKDGGG